MAFLHDVEVALLNQVIAAVGSVLFVNGNRVDVDTAIGWPPEDALQDIAKKKNHSAIISIYDRKISRNSTRWMPITLGTNVSPTGITSTLSNSVIPAGGSVTITIGGAVLPNDAISAVLSAVSRETCGQVAVVSGSTPTDVAAQLAGQINGAADMSLLVSAAAAGPVITLTSLVTGDLNILSATGNIATATREIARRLRQYQIVLWARTEEERIAIGNRLELMVAQMESTFGVTCPDGTMARVNYVNDHDIDDATLEDVMRRDFFVSVDYAITAQDVLYSVLAPIPSFSVE